MKRSILAPPARPSPSSSGREVRSACNSRLRSMKTGVACAVWPLSPCRFAQFTQTDSITYHLNWANVLAGLAEPQKVMDREAKLHTVSAISWTEGPDCTARRLSGPGRFFGPSGCAAQPSSSRLCPTKLHPSNFLCFPLRCHSMYQPAPPRTPPPSCRSCRPSPRCLRDAHASVVELSEDPLAPPWVYRTSSGTRLGPRFCLRSRDDS